MNIQQRFLSFVHTLTALVYRVRFWRAPTPSVEPAAPSVPASVADPDPPHALPPPVAPPIRKLSRVERDLQRWGQGLMLLPFPKKGRKRKKKADEGSHSAAVPMLATPVEPVEPPAPLVPGEVSAEAREFLETGKIKLNIEYDYEDAEDDSASFGLATLESMLSVADYVEQAVDETKPLRWSDGTHGLEMQGRGDALTPGAVRDIAKGGIYFLHDSGQVDNGRVRPIEGRIPLSGAVAYRHTAKDDKDDYCKINIIQAERVLSLPPGYVASGAGWPYRVSTIAWFTSSARRKLRDHSAVVEDGWASMSAYVTVDTEGSIATCYRYEQSVNSFRSKHRFLSVPVMRAVDPDWYWRELRKDGSRYLGVREHASIALNGYQMSDQQWNAIFSGKRAKLIFNFDYRLARRLFAERRTFDVNGRQRAILHFVGAHERVNGSSVRLHVRGERKFRLGSHDVEVVVPGKHRAAQAQRGRLVHQGYMTNAPWYARLWLGRPIKLVSHAEFKRLRDQFDPWQEAMDGKLGTKEEEELWQFLTYYTEGGRPLVGDEALKELGVNPW